MLALSEGKDRALLATAFVVDVVWRHSTRPECSARPVHLVDVASFLRLAGYAKLIVPSKVQLPTGRAVEPLRFCRYCWRLARPGAPVFPPHKMGRDAEPSVQAEDKQAQRVLPRFEREIVAITTHDELEFHDSEFTAPIFTPRDDLLRWLTAKRPQLAGAVGSATQPLLELLDYLGCPELLPLYRDQSHLLTPMTLRAEAHLRAVAAKKRWGGKRAGTGRRGAPLAP